MFETLVLEIAAGIAEFGLWDTWHSDYILNGNELVLNGLAKRRRMNHGLRTALAKDTAEQHRSRTTHSFLSSHPGIVAPTLASRLNEELVCSNVSASWLSFADTVHLAICSDGVRVGHPSKERLVAPAYDVAQARGTWLPPMVLQL